MDFDLSAEEREIRDWVRTFVRQGDHAARAAGAARASGADERGLTAEELQRAAGQGQGSPASSASRHPRSTAGWGVGAVMAALIEIELGRSLRAVPLRAARPTTSSSTPTRSSRSATSCPTIAGDAEVVLRDHRARRRARTPAPSGPAPVREGDDWVINGEKTFITGGNEADFVMVFAVTDKEKGADGGVTCFLVDRDRGLDSPRRSTRWASGARPRWSSRTSACRTTAILGEEGKGFELAMRWIGKGRYMLPARALGACERLVEMGMEHARNRVTFGQPIAERQAIQWMIADSAVEIEALRWLVLTAAWQVDQGLDSRQSQSMAKLYGGVKANEIVDRVLQMHGGMGYTRELPIERWYRELRLLRIYEGTDEIQRRTIARNLLKGHASVRGHLG